MKRLAILALASLLLASTCGCAVVKQRNRHLSRAVAAALWPSAAAARVAVSPLVVPAYAVALAADAVLVNPVLKAPRAFGIALLAANLIPHVPVVDLLAAPVRLVAFAVTFVGADVTLCALPL